MSELNKIFSLLGECRTQVDDFRRRLTELEAETLALARRVRSPMQAGPENIIPASRTIEGTQPIVGGDETSDFPDCCAVGDETGFFCSGTLISPQLVVTAKHCTSPTRVFFGSDTAELDDGQIISISRLYAHEQADLQILVLERAPEEIPPRHIAQGHEVQAQTCILVGFGNTDPSGSFGYGKKRKVEGIPICSLDCRGASDPATFGCIPDMEMVAGQRGLLRDSCTGDSGGPLYTKADGRVHLLGATSRGVRSENVCGDGGVYIRVDRFIDWIEEKGGVNIPGPEL